MYLTSIPDPLIIISNLVNLTTTPPFEWFDELITTVPSKWFNSFKYYPAITWFNLGFRLICCKIMTIPSTINWVTLTNYHTTLLLPMRKHITQKEKSCRMSDRKRVVGYVGYNYHGRKRVVGSGIGKETIIWQVFVWYM